MKHQKLITNLNYLQGEELTGWRLWALMFILVGLILFSGLQ